MSEIKKNYIYNVAYQLLVILLPIITVPYVSRVLGVEGVGIYSYTYSIAYYFILFSMLGINNYGSRYIAKVRKNRDETSRVFLSIYCMQFIITILCIIIYYAYIFLFNVEYKKIAIIQGIAILTSLFDINWFYFGLEKFKITVLRNLIIKILSLICIFIFVKKAEDLPIYTLILSLSSVISCFPLWVILKKYIRFTKITLKNVIEHIKSCLVLFIPVISYSIYKVMDKTMLGSLIGANEVGYYENATKIINIPLGFITALGTVMLPRMSNVAANGDKNQFETLIKKSINFIMFISIPICLGICAISDDFSVLFFGSEFEKTGILCIYLSVTIIFIAMANVVRTQFLIPKERDKEYVISTICGAIINLVLNLYLIPKYESVGACISTVIAEATVMIYQIFAVRKDIPILKYIKEGSLFVINSLIMFILIIVFDFISMNSMLRILLQVVLGILLYLLLNIKYINENIFNINNLVKSVQKIK